MGKVISHAIAFVRALNRMGQWLKRMPLGTTTPTVLSHKRSSIALVSPFFQFSLTGILMCRSARLYNCVLCHRQVIICSHCDHGNSYCSGKCSAQSRQEKQREACDRYQSSSKGRHLHALRQRHYRQRKKKKWTHQGSPELVPYDLLIVELKRVTTNQKPSFSTDTRPFYCSFLWLSV
ncbi:hypothetical protein BPLS_P2820 [Bathymodiolus platifrons methanotrophic gill symbiont]|nr:hypothetical protein BPLS_P2820 [Bathymodiolus platifrons methanotrophic gill symbiont]